MFEIDEFFPGVEVFVEKFSKKNGGIFTACERKPADVHFFGLLCSIGHWYKYDRVLVK